MTGSTITAPGCGMYFDSGNALSLDGASVIADTGGSIGIVGGSGGTASVTPTPVTGIVPATDPLAYLTPPPVPACAPIPMLINGPGSSNVNPGGICYSVTVSGLANVTFNPGEYAGINLSASSGAITFNPGLYVIAVGGLNLAASAGTMIGNGVTFYVGPAGGSVLYNSLAASSLTAPTSGTPPTAYPGILFYQDPTNPGPAFFAGAPSSLLDGVLYFPDAAITWTSTGITDDYMIIVAQSLTLSGGASLSLNTNFTSVSGGSPVKGAVLVE
jgi:hypothetical protein